MRGSIQRVDWLLVSILFLTVASNAYIFSPRLVFVHDTLNKDNFFHFAYREAYYEHAFPRWCPYVASGLPTNFYVLCFLEPLDALVGAAGICLRIPNPEFLHKVSILLAQLVFVAGLWKLCTKLFVSRLTSALVTLCAVLTNSWTFQFHWNFTLFFMLPVVLWQLLIYFETEKVSHLWLAGLFEAVSWFGNLPYAAPIHLLFLTVFSIPFLWNKPSLLKGLTRLRVYLHPLFLMLVVVLALFWALVSGIQKGHVTVSPGGRDASTSRVGLATFLHYGEWPAHEIASAFLLGNVIHGDNTCYLGLMFLAFCGFACFQVRTTAFASVMAAAFALILLAAGGFFAVLIYYVFPLMNNVRHIRLTFALVKFCLLLGGGFGLDAYLQTLRDRRHWRGGVNRQAVCFLGAVAICCADCMFHSLGTLSSDLLSRSSLLVVARLACYGVGFGALERLRAHGNARLVPSSLWVLVLLGGPCLFDVGTYYVRVVRNAPWYRGNVDVTEALKMMRPTYRNDRYLSEESPGRAGQIEQLFATKRTKPMGVLYSISMVTQVEPVQWKYRTDFVALGIRDMFEARSGQVSAGFILPRMEDTGFLKSLQQKMRIARHVEFARDYQESLDSFRKVADPYETVVVTGERDDGPIPAEETESHDSIEVTHFSANRVECQVTAQSAGWLVYAQAFHPGWRARVNGEPESIRRANVGFQAVPLRAGVNRVEFLFDQGLRDWLFEALIGTTFVAGCSLAVFVCWCCFTREPLH